LRGRKIQCLQGYLSGLVEASAAPLAVVILGNAGRSAPGNTHHG